jgi:ADP-heptose:LPS heptosyltransferase
VDAIAAACDGDRAVMAEPASGLSESVAAGIDGKRLFARPVVCVHPAVGTEMRQWPSAYFAELIDLLIERHQVHVILIGGPDEMDIAVAVLDHVRNRRAVWNVVGAFPLADLPSVLRRCVLFVGNNSGPKHIAAGLGVPTVGIHSGVVDAHEWGPLGPRAVAMQRDMSCSPCYLTKMEDCRREFACMKGLRPGDVYRACERLLASGVGVVAWTRAKAPRPSRRTS